MSYILDRIKQAIEDSGEPRNRIALGSGVNPSQLARLVSGERGLSVESVERLAEYLELEIIVRPKRRTRGGK